MKTRFARLAGARAAALVSALARALALAPILALVLAAGVVETAPAPAASASIKPDCAWQALSLFNGWESAQSTWNTGDPAFCVANGVVYLSGSLMNPASSSAEFALLPQYAQPASNLFLQVYTYNGSYGELQIGANGAMSADGSSSSQFTSLAGISFPAAGTSLTPISLNPGWQSAQGQDGSGDPSYVVTDGIVHWAGSATTSTNSRSLAAVPQELTPDHCSQSVIDTYQGNFGIWYLSPPGGMQVAGNTFSSGNADRFTSLAGLSYPANGQATWTPLTLKNGWGPDDGICGIFITGSPTDGVPSYYIRDHVVYLSGGLEQLHPGGGFIGTLPAAAIPQHDLWMLVVAGSDAPAYLHISSTGNMYLFGAAQPTTVLLSGISYQASS
jgi:hypothetical protein